MLIAEYAGLFLLAIQYIAVLYIMGACNFFRVDFCLWIFIFLLLTSRNTPSIHNTGCHCCWST